jgi:predicted ribosomally synthesized peptide with SipW-like signal peptide
MKKIIISLLVIIVVGSSAIAATRAYFSDSQVLGSNTFATGTVKIGGTVGLPLNVTGLGPGIEVRKDIQIGYQGTLNADLWLGVSGTGATPYLADFVKVKIYDPAVGWIFDDYVNKLSGDWLKIATNVANGNVESYQAYFYIDSSFSDNTKQGLTNTDTVLKLYAVQTGGSKPANPPYPGVVTPF